MNLIIDKIEGAAKTTDARAQADELIASIDQSLHDFTVEAIAAGREYANYRMNQCIAVSMSGASLFGECKTILVFACLAYLSAMAWGLSKKFPKA